MSTEPITEQELALWLRQALKRATVWAIRQRRLLGEVQRLRAELSRYHEPWDNDEINIIADMHEHYTPTAASVAIKQLLTLCAGLRAERDNLAEALRQIAGTDRHSHELNVALARTALHELEKPN